MRTDALVMDHVSLMQGSRILLRDADVVIPTGSITLLRGANGTGKTTLFRSILGLHRMYAGEMRVLGETPRKARSRVGYLPQSRRLPAPQFTGRALVTSAWRCTRPGLPNFGRAVRREVDRALMLADAATLADRPIAQLSGGERQRLAMAQALLGAPALLLLDEPLAGLDTQRQTDVAALLGRLHQTSGLTILVSVHGDTALDRYASHELIFHDTQATLRHVAF